MMTATNAVAIPLVLKWATTSGDVMVRAAGTDSELVGSARRGEGEAIARLVERYSARLHRYLTRLTGAPTLAEDILQDTWLRVMDRLDHYNPARPFAVWLFRVAHNCAIDALRKQAREGLPLSAQEDEEGEPRDLLEQMPDRGPSAIERLAEQELRARVETVFAALPAHYREVLTLRFHEDLRLEEIAQVLGAPLSTVKTRVVRALALLRQRVETLGLNHG
jgi:RNA polymerase sigma-70 factor (ECF subfamily)